MNKPFISHFLLQNSYYGISLLPFVASIDRLTDGKGKHRKDSKSPFKVFKKSTKSRDVSPSGRTKIVVTGSDYEYTESEGSEDAQVSAAERESSEDHR